MILANVADPIDSSKKPNINYTVIPPVPNFTKNMIISHFGDPRPNHRNSPPIHFGIDITGKTSTPILAPTDGVITRCDSTDVNGYGLCIDLTPDGGYTFFRFAHLSRALVKVGDKVSQGQKIAYMGNSGNARTTGVHLHFEFRVSTNGKPQKTAKGTTKAIDPEPIILNGYPAKQLKNYDPSNGSGATPYDPYATPDADHLYVEQYFPEIKDFDDEPILRHANRVAQFGMYYIMTDGNGNFIAKIPRFLSKTYNYTLENIEVKSFEKVFDDKNIVTKVIVTPDPDLDRTISFEDTLVFAGYCSLEHYMPDWVMVILQQLKYTPNSFIQKFGKQIYKAEIPLLQSTGQAFFFARYLFERFWRNLYNASIEIVFFPELRPFMNVYVKPDKAIWLIEGSVTHRFSPKGCSTSIGKLSHRRPINNEKLYPELG